MWLIVSIGFVLAVLIAIPLLSAIRLARRRGVGQMPGCGEVITDDSIKELVRKGDITQAARAYRALHGSSFADAKLSVQKIASSLSESASPAR